MMKISNAMKHLSGVVATLAMLGVGQASANADEAVLAQKNGCLACHRGAGKSNGPAYKDVAEKYAGKKNAESQLARHIVQGTGPEGLGWQKEGKASLLFMPPNGNVSAPDARRLARWILGIHEEIPDISKYFVTEQIAVSGAVENKLKLSVEDLRQFPPQQVGELPLVCQSGADRGKLENFKGVLLRDILEKAKVVSRGHNDVKKIAIIASASDGYKVVFSWSEIFNSPVGEGVLVFFEKNGLPLSDEQGRIAMVSTKDIRTGPRHVKWLQGIEVKKIAD